MVSVRAAHSSITVTRPPLGLRYCSSVSNVINCAFDELVRIAYQFDVTRNGSRALMISITEQIISATNEHGRSRAIEYTRLGVISRQCI